MKRLLWLLAFLPLLVNGQVVQNPGEGVQEKSIQAPLQDIVGNGNTRKNLGSNTQKRNSSETPQFNKKLKNESIFVEFFNLGITVYDLQTNSSVGRRIVAYPDSSVSAVWTQGTNEPNFTQDRGTGYNHYDGNEVTRDPESVTRLEDTRTGWPSIGTFGTGSDDPIQEFTITHIAGDPDEGTGGYAFNQNTDVGSADFNTELREAGSGPIWWRTATSGNWLHMIGTYSNNTSGADPEVEDITRPMVYYRSGDRGESWEDSAIVLPGYSDTTKRDFGTADIYSIDARDSVVAIVLAENVLQLTMWKSTDNGETWEMHEIEKSGLTLQEFRTGLWNVDTVDQELVVDTNIFNGDHVSTVIDEDGTVHVTYNTVFAYRDGSVSDTGRYFFLPSRNGIKYWNDESTEEQVLDHVDTNYKDSTVYNYWVEGSDNPVDSISLSYDTAYHQYSYDTATNVKDSAIMDSPRVYVYGNYADSSMQPFVPTDTTWNGYYAIEFDTATGDTISSTLVADTTLYLDSNVIQVVESYDSVFTTEKNYTFEPTMVGDAPTVDTVTDLSFTGGNNVRYPYGTPISSRPTIARGGADTLYIVYEAMVSGTGSQSGNLFDYRDLYLSYSVDGGQSWVEPINVTNTAETNGESAYPSVYKEMVNDRLHLVWQEDEYPDEYASQSDQSIQTFPTDNYINYAAIPISLIFDPNTGIEDAADGSSFEANVYPNPFGSQMNVSFELKQSSEVSYKLYDAMGQVQQQENLGQMNSGNQEVRLQTSGLSNGVYFLQINTNEGTQSLKVVKQ